MGAHSNFLEAKNMIHIAEKTRIPVPNVFACYTYCPTDIRIFYDTYIFMDFIDGDTLHTVWNTSDVATKTRISTQLTIQEMRDLGNGGYIGFINHRPVADHCLSTSVDKSPFQSEKDFNTALLEETYQRAAPKRHIGSFLSCFLPPTNIMVKNGNVVAIIGWELSGWYPEYWEIAKALLIWGWQKDWTDYMRILQPYQAQYFMHQFLDKLLI
ncbi:hypothetical protein PENCOP_c008G00964 [Penicillium coprophilum]|uniref:Aminoglycoside phosphotransferase domain-containing protein n=1 Tax=Penicillium coprophilum TaxID=36646 RepID=A0A1V6UJH6_9EURO|nr:hypothetical protein PENCOP_c008G00964 [Penicillium coprophilum]